MALANSSIARLASPSTRCGILTSKIIIKSPTLEPFLTPRPFTLSVRPLGVPGAMRTVTSSPSNVGIEISAPSAASEKVIGRVK